MNKRVSACLLKGVVDIPPSKSDSQRAILASALTTGTSKLYNVGSSKDELSMLKNIQLLGAKITEHDDHVKIHGVGSEFDLTTEINIGESGLGLRLLLSVCAAIGGEYTFSGEGSIKDRSHHFFEEGLTQLGVSVSSDNGKLPIKISGKLHSGELMVDGSMSSQFLSGLLMALPLLEGDSRLRVRNLRSKPYVTMTMKTLASYGIKVEEEAMELFFVQGGQKYIPCEYHIESDWSSASFWLVAAALGHEIRINGLQRESKQADKILLDILQQAGCDILIEDDLIMVEEFNKTAFYCDLNDAPDLFPILVTLAVFCEGTSEIKGVSRLHNKESDRAVALQDEYKKLGVHITIDKDAMFIQGGKPLRGGEVNSHNDHRIAMALAIAGTMIDEEVMILGADAVNKSYPQFWEHLEMLITQSHIPNP